MCCLMLGWLLSYQTEDEKLHPGNVQIRQEQPPTPHTGSTDPQGDLQMCRGDRACPCFYNTQSFTLPCTSLPCCNVAVPSPVLPSSSDDEQGVRESMPEVCQEFMKIFLVCSHIPSSAPGAKTQG